MKKNFLWKHLLASICLLLFSATGAWAQTSNYFNGFETPSSVGPDNWDGVTRVASGTDGITSAAGNWHAEVPLGAGQFTRFGHSGGGFYNPTFPTCGFKTSLDIYLNVNDGGANDRRFDYSSSINSPTGPGNNFRRDFVFNGGFYNDNDGSPGSGTNRFIITASNNATRSSANPKNPARSPQIITTTGWYTFEHSFRNNGGVLAVDLTIYNSSHVMVATWTLSDPSDIIGTTVGGSRYGELFANEFNIFAIDNSTLTVAPTPVHDNTTGISYCSIQSAVNAANPGDVITVDAGTYNENVTVNKSLTIKGAQSGNDARTRSGAESSVNGGGANFTITADNVTIDGFTLNGPVGSAAIVMEGGNTGETIENNIINNPGTAASINTSNTVFRQNVVNNVFASSTDGFQFNNTPVHDVNISNNNFSGADGFKYNADITIIGPLPSGENSNVVVTGNLSNGDGTLVALFTTNGSQITGNTVIGDKNTRSSCNPDPSPCGSSAIYVGGGNSNVTVSANTVSSAGTAVNVANDFGDGANSGITIIGNDLHNNITGIKVGSTAVSVAGTVVANNNSIVQNSAFGFNNLSTFTADATCNWWGASDRSVISSQITGPVNYTPWLTNGTDTDPASGFQPVPNTCTGGIPKLSTTINNVTVNANNDGNDDNGSFAVCNTLNNILFNSFTDQNGLSNPLLKVYQTISTSNVSVPFCNNCSASMAAFAGATGTATLINPSLPGTLTMRFRSWVDTNNNGIVDPSEFASDWINYTVTVNPLPFTGPISGSTSVCSGSNSGHISLDPAQVVGSVTRWEYSTDDGMTWNTINNTGYNQSYGNLVQKTSYRAVVQSGTCDPVNSNAAVITVNPFPVVSFDLADNSVHHLMNVNNGSTDPTESATLSVCDGNTYTLSNLVNSSPGNRYKVEVVSTSGGGLLFNGSGTGNADISASDFSGAQGTYTVTLADHNVGGSVVQRITPYYDANGNNMQDPGECSGDPITITYNGTPNPAAGITNISGTTVLTCSQTSISVTATGGSSYSWSDGTSVVGTSANLSITAPGTYTVTVTGTGNCTSTSSITIKQNVDLPAVTILVTSTNFCSGLTLTAIPLPAGAYNYLWTPGGETSVSKTLTSANTNGNYTVKVTGPNGCSATSSPYNFVKQNSLNNYTILGLMDVKLGQTNTVNGPVGNNMAGKKVSVDKGSTINGFIKASVINLMQPVTVTGATFLMPAGVTLPPMFLNTATVPAPNFNVPDNTTATIGANYNNLTIGKNCIVTVTGTVYGKVAIHEGAQVTFTQPDISINDLSTDPGTPGKPAPPPPPPGKPAPPPPGNLNPIYTTMNFSGSTVRIKNTVNIGDRNRVNGTNTTFYMGDNNPDAEKFTVNGNDTKVTANVYMPNGTLAVHGGKDAICVMTGTYIAQNISSDNLSVTWNGYDCSNPPPSVRTDMYVGNSQQVISKFLPETFALSNYPNPFAGTSTIKYDLPYDSKVSIKVYDVLGREVTTLVNNEDKKAGSYTVEFNGNRFTKGSLYYRIIAKSSSKQFEQTNKMIQLQ